ncbi:uracil-DNA glycosylase family protein [Kordiimonas aestuarii]|uniref:uracil-DNA glycosylase family protein n=1 Tax=Kordiimonas aestuarii TaxID=1005925 RepID=UPI0021CEF38B|nr:uracil-DNA glycosylase family protein [Kordiimonas aestuarii]
MPSTEHALLAEIRRCAICADVLPFGPRPVVQFSSEARTLIVGQAPGRKVHESGVPFDDASGDRLREWMGIDRDAFYDARRVAILPMGFCYPGTGKSGDLPPRPECAPAWRHKLLAMADSIELTLVIGSYARDWHLRELKGKTLTGAVRTEENGTGGTFLLPHPSPRNNIWLSKNPWFEAEILPRLRRAVARVVSGEG